MDLLNIELASSYPRVSHHIEEIIKVITGLINKGYAYQIGGDVYFEVDRFRRYKRLSGRPDEVRLAGARVKVDPRKKNPSGLALWKETKEGEPFWKSPWGKGRPGWHIECSVISMEYLRPTFDIHGGGIDLIFPHHENEIAQPEAYTGGQMAKYWIHNGFVMINKDKMSKSLGNITSIKKLLNRYPAEVIRFFLLRTHYRSSIDFIVEDLDQAQRGIERFYNTLEDIDWELGSSKEDQVIPTSHPRIDQHRKRFQSAMDDDLNTPRPWPASTI